MSMKIGGHKNIFKLHIYSHYETSDIGRFFLVVYCNPAKETDPGNS
jgi:hypothetical protein